MQFSTLQRAVHDSHSSNVKHNRIDSRGFVREDVFFSEAFGNLTRKAEKRADGRYVVSLLLSVVLIRTLRMQQISTVIICSTRL